ncbi:MAG TPA: ABC transporter ATP-binding protein [Kofleriaceae bacterium]|nr:ABC transporter ATP-binding protein [Kofleriaceae bacterium]
MHPLSVEQLTVHYGKRCAVDHLSIDVEAGQIVGLLGPNGAGKSTALLAIAGAVMPSAGTIRIAGVDLARRPLDAKKRVGFADQPPSLYEFFTVAEHLALVAEARGDRDRDGQRALLAELGLGGVADRPCRELSFGMRQRVGLAAALVGDLALVLLDETLNGLDPHAARRARTALTAAAARGAAVLMSTHLLGVAEGLCQRIVVMDQGRIVDDLAGDELTALRAGGPGALERLYVETIADREAT